MHSQDPRWKYADTQREGTTTFNFKSPFPKQNAYDEAYKGCIKAFPDWWRQRERQARPPEFVREVQNQLGGIIAEYQKAIAERKRMEKQAWELQKAHMDSLKPWNKGLKLAHADLVDVGWYSVSITKGARDAIIETIKHLEEAIEGIEAFQMDVTD